MGFHLIHKFKTLSNGAGTGHNPLKVQAKSETLFAAQTTFVKKYTNFLRNCKRKEKAFKSPSSRLDLGLGVSHQPRLSNETRHRPPATGAAAGAAAAARGLLRGAGAAEQRAEGGLRARGHGLPVLHVVPEDPKAERRTPSAERRAPKGGERGEPRESISLPDICVLFCFAGELKQTTKGKAGEKGNRERKKDKTQFWLGFKGKTKLQTESVSLFWVGFP